ncbi:MAG: hypothetical protein V7K48_07320 [Nostoc sp.]
MLSLWSLLPFTTFDAAVDDVDGHSETRRVDGIVARCFGWLGSHPELLLQYTNNVSFPVI